MSIYVYIHMYICVYMYTHICIPELCIQFGSHIMNYPTDTHSRDTALPGGAAWLL